MADIDVQTDTPAATPQVRFTRNGGGLATTPEQSQRLAEMLRKHGVSEERLQAAAEQDGVTLTRPAPDTRSSVEKMYDAATGLSSTPDSPAAYRFDYGSVPHDVAPVLQRGLHEMQLPASVGSAIGEWAASDASHYASLSPEQRQQYDFEQLQHFTKLHPKNVDEARADVANLIAAWRNAPGQSDVVDNLLRQGWLRSARVQALLYQHAKNLMRRSDLTKGSK